MLWDTVINMNDIYLNDMYIRTVVSYVGHTKRTFGYIENVRE